jgi:dienelactone hydrolase
MSVQKIPFHIPHPENDVPIDADFYFVPTGKPKPLVIFLHGFRGFKEWGPFPETATHLADAGFFAVTFNFSHNGILPNLPSGSPDAGTLLAADRFEQNTLSCELTDVDAVINFFMSLHSFSTEVDASRLAVIGHSRGGGDAILKAATDSRIKAVVTWAAVATLLERYSENQKRLWRERGYMETVDVKSRKRLRIGVAFLNDLETHRDRYNASHAVSDVHVPLLLIHSKADEIVPFSDAEKIFASADKLLTSLLLLDGGNHIFDVTHPFSGRSAALDEAEAATISFLKKTFFNS